MNTRISGIKAREKAATPGPWFWNSYCDIFSKPLSDAMEASERGLTDEQLDALDALPRTKQLEIEPTVCSVPNANGDATRGKRQVADSIFIEHAREDIPYLLAQLEAKEKTIEAVRVLPVTHERIPNAAPNSCYDTCTACALDHILEGSK